MSVLKYVGQEWKRNDALACFQSRPGTQEPEVPWLMSTQLDGKQAFKSITLA